MSARQLVNAGGARQQRGAATLLVVMVLFFVMAMMAAFANRNLVFEQRIASNYYRAGVALEAAEAGAEWALSLLNGVNIGDACLPANGATTSFRQRYLSIDPATREVKPNAASTTASDCVRDAANGWVCHCPGSGAWTASANIAASDRMQPSFGITFVTTTGGRPGVIRFLSTGCTSSALSDCNSQLAARDSSLGKAEVMVDLALVSALKMPPATPLTVKGNVIGGANGIGLHNTDTRSSGLLLLSGRDATGLLEDRLDSLPGTPGAQALISNDLHLQTATADAMFAMFFGMPAAQYREQPAVRVVTCAADCSTALLSAYERGARLVWVDGPMTLSSNIELGSASSPMLIIAAGNVTLNGPMRLSGAIYARGHASWSNSSGQLALLNGALLAEGDFNASGTVDLWYQAEIMNELNNRAGSFVRVPGSWWN